MTDINILHRIREVLRSEEILSEEEKSSLTNELNICASELEDLRELLWDMIIQSCADSDDKIRHMCISVYEEGAAYFREMGWLDKDNKIVRYDNGLDK